MIYEETKWEKRLKKASSNVDLLQFRFKVNCANVGIIIKGWISTGESIVLDICGIRAELRWKLSFWVIEPTDILNLSCWVEFNLFAEQKFHIFPSITNKHWKVCHISPVQTAPAPNIQLLSINSSLNSNYQLIATTQQQKNTSSWYLS